MENKFTIFGEEHFIDNTMIELIEAKNNAIDNMVFDEMEKSIKITLPFIKINAEKLRKWVDLCMQLENIEHSELINIATKKKILDLKAELEELKKNSIVPKFKKDDECYAFTDHFAYFSNDKVKINDIKLTYICQNDTESVTYKEQSLFKTKQEAEEALKKLEEK